MVQVTICLSSTFAEHEVVAVTPARGPCGRLGSTADRNGFAFARLETFEAAQEGHRREARAVRDSSPLFRFALGVSPVAFGFAGGLVLNNPCDPVIQGLLAGVGIGFGGNIICRLFLRRLRFKTSASLASPTSPRQRSLR